MTPTLACNPAWFDSTSAKISVGVTAANTTCPTGAVNSCGDWWYYYGGYWYPNCYPTVTYSALGDPRPIKLKLSEVERLRKAVKDDPKLKAILNKFTTQIEIAVDFD